MQKRRRFNMTRKKVAPKTGFLKVIRWSNKDTGNQCHLTINGSDTVPGVDSTTQFTLNDVNGSGELVALFDQYRITRVLYRWVLFRNPSEYSGATAVNKGVYPRIVWCHDFNDSITISRAQMYQRAGLREVYMTDNRQTTKWYSLKPSLLMQAYESVAATAYVPKWRQWLDTTDNASPHYGIKYSVDNLYAGIALRMEVKLVMECKGIS